MDASPACGPSVMIWLPVHVTITTGVVALYLLHQAVVKVDTCVLQVMKLRRRYDEMAADVAQVNRQKELLLTQISEEKAEWEKLHTVSSVPATDDCASKSCCCTDLRAQWQLTCQAYCFVSILLIAGCEMLVR